MFRYACPKCGGDRFGPLSATTVYGCLDCGESFGPRREDVSPPRTQPPQESEER